MFLKIQKADEKEHTIYLVATNETKDKSNEIMDYEGSKPYFEDWMNYFATVTDGKSYGNVRLQHDYTKPIGKVIAPLEFIDEYKEIRMVVQVLDKTTWEWIEEGVLTGASIGGKLIKKWYDTASGAFRYIVKPSEISLVDTPCNPSSNFLMVKADGTEEFKIFKTIERTEIMSKKDIIKSSIPSEIQKVFQGTDSEKRERLYGALNEKIKVPLSLANSDQQCYYWIIAVYADRVIIEGNLDGDGDYDNYSINYTITDEGVVSLVGDLTQVRQEWVPTVDELPAAGHAEEPSIGKSEQVDAENVQKTEETPEKTVEKAEEVTEKTDKGSGGTMPEEKTEKTETAEVEKTEITSEAPVEKTETVEKTEEPAAKTEETVEKTEESTNPVQKVEENDVQKSVNNAKDDLVKAFHNLTEMGVQCTCEKCSKVYNKDINKAEDVEKASNKSEDLVTKVEALQKTIDDLSVQKTELEDRVKKLEEAPADSNVPANYAIEKNLGTGNQVEKAETLTPVQKINQTWQNIQQNPVVK